MKKKTSKIVTVALVMAACFLLSVKGYSQYKKLPDGSVVYNDGTRKLPNGTVIRKGTNAEANRNHNGVVILPNSNKTYSNGSRRYTNNNRHDDRRHYTRSLPPGQAKKMYGGSARDYAPGQQKKWNGNGHGNGKHHDD